MQRSALLLCLLLSTAGFSQQQYFGITVGNNFSQSIRKGYEHYNSVLGISAQFFYEPNWNFFHVKNSVGFTQKGFQQDLVFLDETGNILEPIDRPTETHLHNYVELTILPGVNYGKKIYGFLNAGPSVSYYTGSRVLLNSVEFTNGQEYSGYDIRQFNISPFDLSLAMESGIGFQFREYASIFLQGRYHHGMTWVRYESWGSNVPWKNNTWHIQMGLRIVPLKLRKLEDGIQYQ